MSQELAVVKAVLVLAEMQAGKHMVAVKVDSRAQ
jgi:hypothetical protein